MKPGYKTYVTGHSLGGAVAALLAIYLIEDGVPVERVVTFGQPRFTTADGVKRLNFLPLMRVVDENDIVPLIAPSTVLDPRFGPYEQVGPEVILLEGPDYVYLPFHDASRISLGEFWRSFTFADLQDHHIEKYLRRIADKTQAANQVPYTERERFVVEAPAMSPALRTRLLMFATRSRSATARNAGGAKEQCHQNMIGDRRRIDSRGA